MPVRKCSNGKYRIGSGDCIYKSRASAERAYAGYRAQKYSESIEHNWFYHATYQPLLASIRAHGLGGSGAQAKWTDSKPGVVYLARDPDVAISYAETADTVPEHWLDQIVVLRIPADSLNTDKLHSDSNVLDDHSTLEYHGIIRDFELQEQSLPAEHTLRDWIDIVEQAQLQEASPNTLEGSFTPDLVHSKRWLCKQLKKHLKQRDADTVYAPGSWYGNIGMFLVDARINFGKLVLIELEQELLDASQKLLWALDKHHKLQTELKSAEQVDYQSPCTVINCSCNETGPAFLASLPQGTLVALQARSNTVESKHITDSLEEFDQLFPISQTLYLGGMDLEDPEMSYTRFLKIGRV